MSFAKHAGGGVVSLAARRVLPAERPGPKLVSWCGPGEVNGKADQFPQAKRIHDIVSLHATVAKFATADPDGSIIVGSATMNTYGFPLRTYFL